MPDIDIMGYLSDPDEQIQIVPIVRDHKNALLFRFHAPEAYDPETIATIQHALIRGIAVVFQLEEGEVLGEPLPQRDNRRAILAYEATEGGAGVLNRLVEDPEALNKIARKALDLMHFDGVDEAVAALLGLAAAATAVAGRRVAVVAALADLRDAVSAEAGIGRRAAGEC